MVFYFFSDSDMESAVLPWESFLGKVGKEIEKAKSQFEEQIQAIKNGSRLSELSRVQIPDLSLPVCSTIPPELPPGSSGHSDHGTVTSAGHGTGSHTTGPEDSSLVPASDGAVGPSSPPLSGPPSRQPGVAPGPECKSVDQETPPEQSLVASRKLPGRATRSSQSPKKPFNSIIEHLSAAFPCYSSTELAGFIKKVRNKNKNSLSGLSIDEIAQRVTEHILDEQKKRKPASGKDKRWSEPSSAAAVTRASQGPSAVTVGPSPKTKGQKTEDIPGLGAASCEICREVFKSKNVRELKCGHKFHKGCFKQWLKGQSTCPACRDRDLR
uniref:RING-type domain-containing protein n=1 Tax=Suricata suricatta TaxID=37032 RepID=A0A673SPN8_SURSU